MSEGYKTLLLLILASWIATIYCLSVSVNAYYEWESMGFRFLDPTAQQLQETWINYGFYTGILALVSLVLTVIPFAVFNAKTQMRDKEQMRKALKKAARGETEREIVKEVIAEVRCPHCHKLHDESNDKCPHCGASI